MRPLESKGEKKLRIVSLGGPDQEFPEQGMIKSGQYLREVIWKDHVILPKILKLIGQSLEVEGCSLKVEAWLLRGRPLRAGLCNFSGLGNMPLLMKPRRGGAALSQRPSLGQQVSDAPWTNVWALH